MMRKGLHSDLETVVWLGFSVLVVSKIEQGIGLIQIRTQQKGEMAARMAAITRNLLNPGCFCLIRSAVRKIDVQGSTSKHATYIH